MSSCAMLSTSSSSSSSLVSSNTSTAPSSISFTSTLSLGMLDNWMNQEYLYRCIQLLGWDRSPPGFEASRLANIGYVKILVDILRHAPGVSHGLLHFETPVAAAAVFRYFHARQAGMPMPGSGRLFTLDWAVDVPLNTFSVHRNEGFTIHVANLPNFVTDLELAGACRRFFHSVLSATVIIDPLSGFSLSQGIVHLDDPRDLVQAANMAQCAVSPLSIRGHALKISLTNADVFATSPPSPPFPVMALQPPMALQLYSPPVYPNHLDYLNSVAPPLTLGTLQTNAPVIEAMPPPPSRLASGEGSILAGLPSEPVPGRTSPFNTPDKANRTLFVGGLPRFFDEDGLRALFERFGDLIYVSVPHQRGCGFVAFAHRDQAEQALVSMHNYRLGPNIRLRLSWGRVQCPPMKHHGRKTAKGFDKSINPVVADAFVDASAQTLKRISSRLASMGYSTDLQACPEDESISPVSTRFDSFRSSSPVSVRTDGPFPGMLVQKQAVRHTASAPSLAHTEGSRRSIQSWSLPGWRDRVSSCVTFASSDMEPIDEAYTSEELTSTKKWEVSPHLHRSASSPAHLTLADMALQDGNVHHDEDEGYDDGDFGISRFSLDGQRLFVNQLVSEE